MEDKVQGYIMGASSEIERAEKWISTAKAHPLITVPRDWTTFVRGHAGKPERDLAPTLRQELAEGDLEGLINADFAWLLFPPPTAPTKGAWIEFGFALAQLILMGDEHGDDAGIDIIVSGAHWRDTIFTELADEKFDTDEEAWAWIRGSVEDGEDDE